MLKHFSVALFLVCCCTNSDAQASAAAPSPSGTTQTHTIASATTAIFKPGGFTVSVYGGRYDVSYEPQFIGVRNKYGLGIGLSADFAHIPYLALDLEFMYANRDYDTPVGAPLWGTIDNDTSVQTSALLVGVRGFYPDNGVLRGYVSVGFGYFQTRMVVSGSVLGFPGVYEVTDSSIEPYYGLGIGYTFGNWGLSLDMRYFELKGNFSGFNISNANLGGDLLLVGWHYRF